MYQARNQKGGWLGDPAAHHTPPALTRFSSSAICTQAVKAPFIWPSKQGRKGKTKASQQERPKVSIARSNPDLQKETDHYWCVAGPLCVCATALTALKQQATTLFQSLRKAVFQRVPADVSNFLVVVLYPFPFHSSIPIFLTARGLAATKPLSSDLILGICAHH